MAATGKPEACAAWEERRQIWRNYLGHQMYTVTDAGYYIYRDLILRRCLNKWIRTANLNVGSALDFGCGTGETVIYLAKKFPAATVIGVDISPFMIEKARERGFLGSRVVFAQTGDDSLTIPPCDLIVTAMVLQHNDDDRIRSIFSSFRQLLRPGGRLLLMESVVPAVHEKTEQSYVARSSGHYEALLGECGLTVDRSQLLSSPVYRRMAPVGRRLAESVAAAAAVSPKVRMSLIDIACTPAVLATYATDSLLSRDAGWGYKIWWVMNQPGS